MYFKVHFVNF